MLRTTLILIAGLPGTGKTTVARAFATLSGSTHFNSDALRREMELMGHYTSEDKAKVYRALLRRTREALLRNETVVVDSTFFQENLRAPFRDLASECGARLLWVEVQASEPTLRKRLSRPRPDSEADLDVYEKIRDQFEPLPDDRLVASPAVLHGTVSELLHAVLIIVFVKLQFPIAHSHFPLRRRYPTCSPSSSLNTFPCSHSMES